MTADILRLEACEVDLERRLVRRDDGHEQALTEQEHGLLAYLSARPGQTVHRDDLLEHVWGYSTQVVTRAIDVAVRRLRAKIEADPSAPVHVLAVRGVGYRFEGPPRIGVVTAQPTPLPHERSTFVGRDHELQRLEQLWAEGSRLITITGAPGAGKSRLALRFGHVLADRSEAVIAVSIADAHSPEGGLVHVAAALGVTLQPTSDPQAAVGQLFRALRARGPLLLILDDAEHLVAAVALAATICLSNAAELRLLVTSRERLRVRGESVLALGPLPTPDAAALLFGRAHATRADWGDGERGVVEQIVDRLDGNPLAIELAAARAAVLSATALHAALDQRFRLLEARGRDATDRQATLERAIDWSWSLLTDWERSALAQLSVFTGGFSGASAGEVLDLSDHPDAPWVLDQVQALVERSLVQTRTTPAGQIRFRLLESIRLYAAGRADELGVLAAAQDRHLDHFLELGEHLAAQVHATEGAKALRRLALESDNLRAAFRAAVDHDPDRAGRIALALDDVIATGGRAGERVATLDAALLADPAPWLQARLRIARARPRILRGDAAGARADGEQALQLAEQLDDDELRRRALLALGEIAAEAGDVVRARESATACAALSREAGDTWYESRALRLLAAVAFARGDLQTQEHTLGRLEDLVRQTGDPMLRANVRHLQARHATALEQHPLAIVRYEEALALSREAGDLRRASLVEGDLAFELCVIGDLPRALEHFEHTLQQHRAMGHLRSAASVAGNVGQIRVLLGRLDDALQVLDEAVADARVQGTAEAIAPRLSVRGLARLVAGDIARARVDLEEALELFAQTERRFAHARYSAAAAIACARLGAVGDAHAHLVAARAIEGSRAATVFADAAGAAVARADGRRDESEALLEAARAQASEGGQFLGSTTWEFVLPQELTLIIDLAAS